MLIKAQPIFALMVLATVQGCIPIPLSERPQTRGGLAVRALVGSSSSDRPIRLDVTTRLEIKTLLGEPRWRTRNEAALGYHFVAASTYWIGPFVVPGPPHVWPFIWPYTTADYFLFLQFDQTGVLRRYQLKREEAFNDDADWNEFLKPVNDRDSATTRPAPEFDRARGKPLLDSPDK